jgi:NAD(P)-dependent dehydrogenase (short-subunit alcohol dehydrogenase family)
MNLVDLTGKRVLVTGASSGIGRACAILAAELGASVVLTGRRSDALDETWRRMENPDQHLIVDGDITSADFVQELAQTVGKLDGLVHAAGIGPAVPIGMVDAVHVETVFRTNYVAFLDLMRVFGKTKYRNTPFSAVVVSSIAAEAGWGGVSVYAGSKGAVCASVRALAMELAAKGVRVNAVCPGHIDTPMLDAVNRELLAAKQPLGIGRPVQVAAPVCFLLSDASSFMTGVNMPVDGGYLAQ